MPLLQTFGAKSAGEIEEPNGSWIRPAIPLALAVMFVSMASQFRGPLLPEIGRDLDMSATQLGLVATMFAFGRLAFDLPIGRLADRIDPLKLLAYAGLATAVGSIVLGAAPSAGWVFASSALLGMASATGNTTGMTALSGAAPAGRRGTAMAMYSGSLLGGQSLGPTISGAVAGVRDWRWAAYSAALLGLIVAAGAAIWHRRPGHVPLQRAPRDRNGDEGPELTTLQRNVLYSVGFSVFFTMGSMPQTLVPLIGSMDYDLPVATIGLALGLGGVSRLLGAAVTGQVSDRISRRAALVPGLALQTAGVALMALGGTSGLWVAAIVLMSLGSTGAGVGATMLGDRTSGDKLGHTLGRYRFASDIGLITGPALAAFTYDRAGRLPAVLLVASVLAVCAVTAVIVLPETYSAGRGVRRRSASEVPPE